MTALFGKIFIGILIATGLILVTPKSTQDRLLSAVTHRPADQVDKAKTEEKKSEGVVDTHEKEIVHQIALEADKTVKAAAQLPPSQTAGVVQRMAGNTSALANQISPLTATEAQNNTTIILGLLADEMAKRLAAEKNLQVTQADLATAQAAKAAAEALQQKDEQIITEKSAALVAAQKDHAAAVATVTEREGDLRKAFDRENALANDYRAVLIHRWALGIGLALAGILFLWVKFEMGNVGKTLHGFESTLNPAAFHDFVAQLDAKVGPLGQVLIREGKAAQASAQAKAKSMLSGAVARIEAQKYSVT